MQIARGSFLKHFEKFKILPKYFAFASLMFSKLVSGIKAKLCKNIAVLETLLNHTNLRIAVYNGNLDVVTPLAGATNWVHALKWRGSKELMNATRIPIKGHRNGFYKTARQLSLWSVFGSGHWVPEENPVAMEEILKYLMSAEYR